MQAKVLIYIQHLIIVSFFIGNILIYFGLTISKSNNTLVMVLIFYLELNYDEEVFY